MLSELKKAAIEAVTSIFPLAIVIIILQLTVLHVPEELFRNFLIGVAMTMVGVTLFLAGVRMGILPMGRDVGAELPQHESVLLIAISAAIFGFVITVTELVMVLSERLFNWAETA